MVSYRRSKATRVCFQGTHNRDETARDYVLVAHRSTRSPQHCVLHDTRSKVPSTLQRTHNRTRLPRFRFLQDAGPVPITDGRCRNPRRICKKQPRTATPHPPTSRLRRRALIHTLRVRCRRRSRCRCVLRRVRLLSRARVTRAWSWSAATTTSSASCLLRDNKLSAPQDRWK